MNIYSSEFIQSLEPTLRTEAAQLCLSLQPYIKAASFTELCRSAYLNLVNQVTNRLSLLALADDTIAKLEKEYASAIRNSVTSNEYDVKIYNALRKSYGHFPLFSRSSPLRSRNLFLAALNASGLPATLQELRSTLTAELDFVHGVSVQLDKLNTIDHPFLECPDLPKMWREYLEERPAKIVKPFYLIEVKKGLRDEAYEMLLQGTYALRKAFANQRLLNELRLRDSQGWYVVFNTLTFSDDGVIRFADDPNALRDHFRAVGRAVLQAENRSVKENSSDCFRYFCVPEYGSKEGRLHFHCLYMMRTLPKGATDPNLGHNRRDRRQVTALSGFWSYGYSMPIAVRYQGDAFTRAGWLWPLDKMGKSIQSKPCIAVARYVCKYVGKNIANSYELKTGKQKWNTSLSKLAPDNNFNKHHRIRMSRGFGMDILPMTELSLDSLVELTQLETSSTWFPLLCRQKSRQELRSRMANLPVGAILAAKPATINLLASLRDLILTTGQFKPLNVIATMTPKLHVGDISDETKSWLIASGLIRPELGSTPTTTFGAK